MKLTNPPKHVAVIMDGNGRWAQRRSHPRVWGHVRGSFKVSEIIQAADDFGVKALTLYSFSTENWGRPKGEISILFKLLHKFLNKEKKRIIKNKIRFKVMGDLVGLPKETVELVSDLEKISEHHQGLKLTIAFGYGSKNEIIHSINTWIKNNPGKFIEESNIRNGFYVPDSGDVDLLIRTGGDHRLSNFLLWQIAYAELKFTHTPWPEFSRKEFQEILKHYESRERRFGLTSGQVSSVNELRL